MQRDDAEFEDLEQEHDPGDKPTAAGPPEGPVAEPVRPDSEQVAAARQELVTAEQLLESSRAELAAAEDALADTEGEVAVAEITVQDYEADKSLKDWQKAAGREQLAKARRKHSRAGRRMGSSAANLEEAEGALRQAVDRLAQIEQLAAAGDEAEPVRRFASLQVFVEEYVLPNWVHKIGADYGGIWCSLWWSHPEAVTRLEALWEAFEVMRRQPPPSLSTWLRDHFDPHMHALTNGHGVFFACDVDRKVHANSPEWPAAPAPDGMFAVHPKATVHAVIRKDEGQQQQQREEAKA